MTVKKPQRNRKESPIKQKIIDTALAEFNAKGIDGAAVHKIAAQLSISPGNLTYHFKRKEDLVQELVKRLENELVEKLVGGIAHKSRGSDDKVVPIVRIETSDAAERMVSIVLVLWNNRFFFLENQLVRDSEELAKLQVKLEKMIVASHQRSFELAVASRNMSPFRPPNSSKLLAENVWAIWMTWINKGKRIQNSSVAEKKHLKQLLDHYFCLVEPYWEAEFAARFYEELLAILKRVHRDEQSSQFSIA